MDYFLLKQDKRYSNTPQIIDLFKNINTKDLNLLKADNIEDNNCFYVKSNDNICLLYTSYYREFNRYIYGLGN